MTRTARTVAGMLLAGAVALVGLTGCDRAESGADTTDLSWDSQALQSVGFATEDVVVAAVDDGTTPAPGGADRRQQRFQRLKYAFRNTLHAEAVVQTEEGTKTVVVQRGTATAVSATSITVKSSDGYTVTWTVGADTKVVVNRAKADIASVAVGTQVGVAGAKDGDVTNARLVVVPKK